jgi:hypothetical protein
MTEESFDLDSPHLLGVGLSPVAANKAKDPFTIGLFGAVGTMGVAQNLVHEPQPGIRREVWLVFHLPAGYPANTETYPSHFPYTAHNIMTYPACYRSDIKETFPSNGIDKRTASGPLITPLSRCLFTDSQASLRSVGWHGQLHQDAIAAPNRRRLNGALCVFKRSVIIGCNQNYCIKGV